MHVPFPESTQLSRTVYVYADTCKGVSYVHFILFSPTLFYAGARMLYNPHDILLRRKIEEQAELQQVLELQERRLKNLQLPDFKNNPIHHHQRSLSVGTPLVLPHQLHSHINDAGLSPDSIKGDITG